ncbi:hypothetical protein E2C01_074442 [Portunus trituberculatus]|uniref:Uncharacterized protein n=1 Tax=Portunus trituberculatus TaxID=210409 RepID=A0A5B7IDI8_PORTR|nr:hypothetical protein [Portunus trituberculatus]
MFCRVRVYGRFERDQRAQRCLFSKCDEGDDKWFGSLAGKRKNIRESGIVLGGRPSEVAKSSMNFEVAIRAVWRSHLNSPTSPCSPSCSHTCFHTPTHTCTPPLPPHARKHPPNSLKREKNAKIMRDIKTGRE